jgi:hypothetical protein
MEPAATEPNATAARGVRLWAFALRYGPWLLVALPIWLLHDLMGTHAVNAPFLDDFMSMRLYQKAAQEPLVWHDFFAAQMEHRIAFTRAVLLFFNKFWPGNWVKQMWFSYALLCLTFANVSVLLRQSVIGTFHKCWPLLALAALMMFSPVQFQVLTWAFMHQVVGLAFFLTATLAVWRTNWPAWVRWLLALLCTMCATLSFGSGILLWLLAVPVIIWSAPMTGPRQRAVCAVTWLAAFAVTMFCYFHGIKNEVDPEFSLGQGETETIDRNISAVTKDLGKTAVFAVRVLGSAMARGSNDDMLDAAFRSGLVMLVLLSGCAAYAVMRVADGDLRKRLVPWFALGAYSPGAAILITMGRIWVTHSGVNAVSGRYLIHAVPLMVALPVLCWIIAEDLAKRFPALRSRIQTVLLILGVALVMDRIVAWTYGERMMEMWSSSRLREAVNMRFEKLEENGVCGLEYDFLGDSMRAAIADDLGLLKPPMLKDTRLENFRVLMSPVNRSFGGWTTLRVEKADDGLYLLGEGFARLKMQGRVADGVFLTVRTPDQGWNIFRVAQVNTMPLHLLEMLRKDLEYTFYSSQGLAESLARFDARFKISDLPKGKVTLAAWACDYRANSVMLIPEFYEVDTEAGTVKSLGDDPSVIDLQGYVQRTRARR